MNDVFKTFNIIKNLLYHGSIETLINFGGKQYLVEAYLKNGDLHSNRTRFGNIVFQSNLIPLSYL